MGILREKLTASGGVSAEVPPRTGEFCPHCPKSDLVAFRKDHFGNKAWHFECPFATETFVEGSGFVVTCSDLDRQCGVENGQDVFVYCRNAEILKSFFETSLRYLGMK